MSFFGVVSHESLDDCYGTLQYYTPGLKVDLMFTKCKNSMSCMHQTS